ncbi:MAG: hypothetical protein ACXW30_00885 [Micavibrio sp.]
MTIEKKLNPAGDSHVEWSTIIGGAILALAISAVLLQFGAAVGIANTESLRGSMDASAEQIIGAGVYILLIQLIASMCGGYVAGRMRAPVAGVPDHEREIRDGMHGLLVWATGTITVIAGLSLATFLTALAAEPSLDAEKAQDVIDREKNMAIILAFSTAATSLISAVASWFAATKGGDHRDQQTDHSRHVSFKKRQHLVQ